MTFFLDIYPQNVSPPEIFPFSIRNFPMITTKITLHRILKINFQPKFSDDFLSHYLPKQIPLKFFWKMFWSPGFLYMLTVSLEKVPEGSGTPLFII